ncbi:peptidoglycan recognition family protein [uncultured Clostridium sp.]|uniref:peptidoglycan recognition protein family protein n=1 Tax=uncultured Clostridium sp. TaxID=59620 RepID=UPI0025844F8B|nr:peptidoglycan recognition family protein [uncultured Clostridium sp.]
MFIILKINRKYLLLSVVIIIILLVVILRDYIREGLRIDYKRYYNVKVLNEDIEELKKNLSIIDLNYDWNENLTFNNNPNKIIYHHCARSYWSPEDINEYHKAKGWKGIGYNFYIRKDGDIYSGRPENSEGAHTKGENSKSIGICLEGNFEEDKLTKEQIESLINLSIYISLKYDIYKIVGHKDVYETLCPGKNFPLKDIKTQVIKGMKNYKK